MTRTLQFIKDFNGILGSRMTMMDFYNQKEIDVYKNAFLRDNRTRTIAAVGYHGCGVFGIQDEIYDDAMPTRFRLLDGAIPSDLLNTRDDENRIVFPENMRDDLIITDFQVDIDILTPPPPELQRAPRNPERPAGERWVEAPMDAEIENGKTSIEKR